jgi:hypothetical protein
MAGKKGMKHRASTSPAFAEALRARIQAVKILQKLESHVLNDDEMSATQVTAGLGLLRKVCPDQTATEVTGNVTQTVVNISNA